MTFLQEHESLISPTAQLQDSVVIPPTYIGDDVAIKNTVVGPYVSVGSHTHIEDARIQNSIVQTHSILKNVNLKDSMLGNYVHLTGKNAKLNIGDYANIMSDE